VVVFFSLILATVNRVGELNNIFESLNLQSYQRFEVIVVDQNDDDRLRSIIDCNRAKCSIKWVKAKVGLSHARNVGLRHIKGDIVAFVDDDCYYPTDLLQKVVRLFSEKRSCSGITGMSIDETGCPSQGRWMKHPTTLNKWNVWRGAISYTIFLKREITECVGYFDEALGIGSGTQWGSAEETDYLIRAIAQGYEIYYRPDIYVYHPQRLNVYNEETYRRALLYGAGMGHVFRKHGYGIWYVLYNVSRALTGAFISLLTGHVRKAKYHWWTFRGRINGWLASI
jgi:glycosyltransferase involved in cell wall biosynthesis